MTEEEQILTIIKITFVTNRTDGKRADFDMTANKEPKLQKVYHEVCLLVRVPKHLR